MSIKESHEIPTQVFGGGGRRDTLNEVGSGNSGVKLDDITCSIHKGDGRNKLDHGNKFHKFGWNRERRCCGDII